MVKQTSPLENLTGPGKPLHKEPPDQNEINGLVQSATVRLRDAEKGSLAFESRFDLVYAAWSGVGCGSVAGGLACRLE